jgi:hypothetical protein
MVIWLHEQLNRITTIPIPVSAHHARAPLKILTMLSGAQTLTGVVGDVILDKLYYDIRTAQIQTRHWWIF